MASAGGFIFDMDGVLVNTNPWHRLAWREFCGQYGLRVTDEELENRMYGRRNDEILRAFFGEGLPAAEIWRRSREKEALFRSKIRSQITEAVVPGVREFLNSYKQYPAALASNAERANIDFVLSELGLGGHFQALVNGSDVTRPKPAPEIYLRAAEMLGLEPAECLVFEDSVTGVTAARAAGMRVVGLQTTHPDLPGAEVVVEDFHAPRLRDFLRAVLR